MTRSPSASVVTVPALRRLLQEWPDRGADGAPTQILLGDAYPDAAALAEPAVSASAIELDDGGSQHLILYPRQREIPTGSLGDKADALDLAMAALCYQLTTPLRLYDPEHANELAVRAVTAIDAIKRLRRLFL